MDSIQAMARRLERRLSQPQDIRFDYDNQAWIKDGRYVRCGHPSTMDCGCYGKEHEGEKAPNIF